MTECSFVIAIDREALEKQLRWEPLWIGGCFGLPVGLLLASLLANLLGWYALAPVIAGLVVTILIARVHRRLPPADERARIARCWV